MKWIKKGQIFLVDGNSGWMNSHAQIPTVIVLEDRLRVYFSTREKKTESKTTYLDLDIKDPKKILYVHDKPILTNGKPGTFDEHGVMPAGAVKYGKKVYLYYSGWSQRCTVPYSNLTGLALSEDNGETFRKVSDGPILSTNIYEPYSATSPFVFLENEIFHMFYCSGADWIKVDNKYEHTYDLKYASSKDGIHFHQNGKTVVQASNKKEALTRPVVIKIDELYHMYFCYRGSDSFRDGKDAYKIGYAWSEDLKNWFRDDKRVGINLNEEGWDSKMMAYPYVLKTPHGTYMFYNGNGFGQSGFGYALLNEHFIDG